MFSIASKTFSFQFYYRTFLDHKINCFRGFSKSKPRCSIFPDWKRSSEISRIPELVTKHEKFERTRPILNLLIWHFVFSLASPLLVFWISNKSVTQTNVIFRRGCHWNGSILMDSMAPNLTKTKTQHKVATDLPAQRVDDADLRWIWVTRIFWWVDTRLSCYSPFAASWNNNTWVHFVKGEKWI